MIEWQWINYNVVLAIHEAQLAEHGGANSAFVVTELFLGLNGYGLNANDADCVTTMLGVAMGAIDDAAFARWIRTQPLRAPEVCFVRMALPLRCNAGTIRQCRLG